MSTEKSFTETATNGIRIALGIGGVLALIVGLLILIWPGKTAIVVTAIIAVYAIIAGLAYAGIGAFSKSITGWSRVGHIALGLLYIVAGIIAFANLGATAVFLATFIGFLVGAMWIVEGIVALTTLSQASSKAWTIFYSILSIIAGVLLFFSPLWGAVVLWWLLGISAIVLGVVNIVRAFTFGGKE